MSKIERIGRFLMSRALRGLAHLLSEGSAAYHTQQYVLSLLNIDLPLKQQWVA